MYLRKHNVINVFVFIVDDVNGIALDDLSPVLTELIFTELGDNNIMDTHNNDLSCHDTDQ